MESIVIFNNKGGVGKTTLLCNMSAFLKIKRRKKVIVIDADPQCNATAYLFPQDRLEEIYDKSDGTVFDILKPVQRGKGYLKGNLPILKSPRFEVDIIAGDPRLSLAEDFLGKDWIDGKSGDYRGLQTTLVFRDLLIRLRNYDYVFFDVGPSLGALNRAILLACDYFVIPMSSDIFSLKAIENISTALKEWKEGLEAGMQEYQKKEREDFLINDEEVSWNLQFIGYITQQYTAKTVDGKKVPVNAYEKIIKKIPSSVKRELSPFNAAKNLIDFKLGEVPSLHSLIPLSQNANTPIFCLQARDGVVGAHFNKVRDYEDVISVIADQLIENIEITND